MATQDPASDRSTALEADDHVGPDRTIFVGGSGRSGTTATARMLGEHSTLAMVPAELRIHVRSRGLGDLLAGRSDLEFFQEQMRTRWYRREHDAPDIRDEVGLFEIVESEEELHRLLAEFEPAFQADPDQAARALMHGLLDPVATAVGAGGWVEHSPENVTVAPTLYRLFPDLKFVHSIKDGRDVARSMTQVPWGPDNIPEAIRWWGRRLGLAHRQTAQLPPDRLHVLHFEELVAGSREETYAALLDFLELEDEPHMHQHFEEHLDPDRAHIGGWKDHIDPSEHVAIDALYDGVLESLRAQGASLPSTAAGRPRLEGLEREIAIAEQSLYEIGAASDELATQHGEAVERYEKRLGLALANEASLRGKLESALERMEGMRERSNEHIDRIRGQVQRTKARAEKVVLLRDRALEAKEGAERRAKEAEERAASLERELELLRSRKQ